MASFNSVLIGLGAIAVMAAAQAIAQPAAPSGPPGAPPVYGAPTATTFTSKIGFFTMERDPGASYPRVIQLKIGADKGTLLATYQPSRQPADLSQHRQWRQLDASSEVPQLRGQPCLYELPVKMGEFPAGTRHGLRQRHRQHRSGQAAAGCGVQPRWRQELGLSQHHRHGRRRPLRPGRPRRPFARPESDLRTLSLCRLRRTGWSPISPTSATRKTATASLLDHVVSEDGGKTWGPLVYDVAIPDGLSRPGMPIVARDGKGKYYMSYELVSAPGYALEPRTNAGAFPHLGRWPATGAIPRPPAH